MTESKDTVSSAQLSNIIVKGIQEKKGKNISIIDLTETGNAIANYFVICTGNSDKQVDAIAESVEKEVYKAFKEDPWHKEGFQNKEWVLLDFADVVVHVFRGDLRERYNLEGLWGDAKITWVDNID